MLKRLVIKGSLKEAIEAANDRGVILDTAVQWNTNEVIAFARIDEPTANKWFCEQGTPPYNSGTLLFYTDEH